MCSSPVEMALVRIYQKIIELQSTLDKWDGLLVPKQLSQLERDSADRI